MKKYRTAIIILLAFLCLLSAAQCYGLIRNIYSVVYYNKVTYDYPKEILMQQMKLLARAIFSNVFILGFSVFGIVVFAKMLQDKQLFTTVAEQPATPNSDETPTNKE